MTHHSQSIIEDRRHHKPNLTKYILVTFIVLFLCSGILFILRGYFLDKDQLFDNSNLISNLNEVVKFNNPIRSDSKPNTKGDTIDFGKNIKNAFKPNDLRKIWVMAENNISVVIGYIDTDGNFNTVYTLPKSVRSINLYEDESITFIQSEDSDTFVGQKPGEQGKAILTLRNGENLISAFFEPETKVFYFVIKDENEEIFIDSMDLKKARNQIYKTDLLEQNSEILFANSTNLWFKTDDSCYILRFFDKSVQSFDCKFIRSNFEGVLYTSNVNPNGTYSSLIAGEIYQINQLTQSEASFFKGSQGDVFSNISFSNNNIVFLKSRLLPSANFYVAIPESISLLSNNSLSSLTNKFPSDTFVDVRFDGQNIFLILKDSSNKHKIYKYKEQVPSSYPVNNDFWTEVKLGITSLDELKFL